MNRFLEMQTFAAVVEAGSFVAAAAALGQSKAAVSRHVSRLESRLGVRLLQRTTRRLSLTQEGELFLARCREVLTAVDEAEAELTAGTETARGLLRINVPVSFGIRRLAPLWGEFRERHPQVDLDITLGDRVVDLVEEGIDLAVRIGILGSSSLVARQLTTIRLVVCASPCYLAANGAPSHPRDLDDHSAIGYSYWSGGDSWQISGPGGNVDARVRPTIRSNNGETCRALAVAGHGIALQPDFIVDDDLASGALVELLPGFAAPRLGVYAVYPTRRHVAPKVRAIVAFLAEHLGA